MDKKLKYFLYGFLFSCFILPILNLITDFLTALGEWQVIKISKKIFDIRKECQDLAGGEDVQAIGFRYTPPEENDEEEEDYE